MNIIRSFQESCKIHARYLKYKYKRIMHYKPRSSQESCNINQDPVGTLARFRSGHYGQIFHDSITNDLSEPYDNLGKILVRSPWPNLAW